ncbi:NAD-dependent epimerase/dehydratase family protein [Paenibacillus bovis]|uniref:Epimerase n=1 Tax=Paenibacillus bovis TaxID=1616788 RepID=A0A172ZJA2_9BACL|nr:NAD(P)-dependent oxidoreductase [Paenibacillus bovis]ANF97619.1 epimerase [Paenibacillus bovis]
MRILITGSSGRIGTALTAYLVDNHDLVLADLHFDRLPPEIREQTEQHVIDLSDLKACLKLTSGIDRVVHLAGNPSPDADFYEHLLDNNIKGSYNLFHACQQNGVQRIVFASSAQTMEAYPVDVQTTTSMQVRPKNMYGVSKVFLESLASYYAYEQGLESVGLRIGAFDDFHPGEPMTVRDTSAYLSPRDLCQLVEKGLTAQLREPFLLVNAISDNRFKRLNIEEAIRELGYKPQDDAFALQEIFKDRK